MSETPKTPRNWTRILLVVSLALNLAIVGIVAGAMFSDGPKNGSQRFDLSVGPLTRAMEPDQRDSLRAALRDSGAFQRADRAAIRSDMNALVATLRAADFDADAFRAALTRQRARLQNAQDAALDAVTQSVSDMSAPERAAFADRLEEQLRRGPPPRQTR